MCSTTPDIILVLVMGMKSCSRSTVSCKLYVELADVICVERKTQLKKPRLESDDAMRGPRFKSDLTAATTTFLTTFRFFPRFLG